MAAPLKKVPSLEEESESKSTFGFLKSKVKNITKDAFDFCFESIEEKSQRLFDHYEEKTASIASKVVHDQTEVVHEAEKSVRAVVRSVFMNFENTFDLLMARALSLLLSVSFVYIAIQLHQEIQDDGLKIGRIALTFYLLTLVLGTALRLVRWIFDFHASLREFLKWQFITGSFGLVALGSYGIVYGVNHLINWLLTAI